MRRLIVLFAVASIAACDGAPNPNSVEQARLRPVLLKDDPADAAYMAKLPEGLYKEYRVDGLGKFYIDDDQDFIKRFIKGNHVWEPHLVKLFEQHVKPGTTVIDAGAHIGTHTVTLARLAGPEGRVYSFEPQRKLYRELVFNLKLNELRNVVPLRFALGHTAAVVEMDPATEKNEGGTQLGKGGDKVELRTIDSFGFRNVSLMKIDVEQFEDFLLEGAQLTIALSRPVIVIEIMGGFDYKDAPPEIRARIDATRARLRGMGYKVSHITAYDYLALPEQ